MERRPFVSGGLLYQESLLVGFKPVTSEVEGAWQVTHPQLGMHTIPKSGVPPFAAQTIRHVLREARSLLTITSKGEELRVEPKGIGPESLGETDDD